eukprot:COSAG01_NODE_5751_length_4058_cov_23.533721_2_plen_722_part_00
MKVWRAVRQALFVLSVTVLAALSGEWLAQYLFGVQQEVLPAMPELARPPPRVPADVPSEARQQAAVPGPMPSTAKAPPRPHLTQHPPTAPPPPPPPTLPALAHDDPAHYCPVYAIPTTGHRSTLTELVVQLRALAKVAGARIHVFVDDTAKKADERLLADLIGQGVHVHRCGDKERAQQRQQHPARVWPPHSTAKELEAAAAQVETASALYTQSENLYYHYALILRTMFEKKQVPYLAVLEDDLAIAQDIDGYLCRHAQLMELDRDIVQVTTHNDAGFWPTAADPHRVFRHEHFAQPGWMTSKDVWHRHIAPRWVGPVNGHWDLAMQYLVFGQGNPVRRNERAGVKVGGILLPAYGDPPSRGRLNTLAPEVPRSQHRRTRGGLTMEQAGYGSQLLDFDNIHLNSVAVDWTAAPLHHLVTRAAYAEHVGKHIRMAAESGFVDCVQALASHAGRRTALVLVLDCASDDDRGCWNSAMLGTLNLFGVGLGGVPRGVFQGTVFVRWQTNLVLLIGGGYSPFAQQQEVKAWQHFKPRGFVCSPAGLAAPPPGVRLVLGGTGQSCEQACAGCCEPGLVADDTTRQHMPVELRPASEPRPAVAWRCDVELLSLLNPPLLGTAARAMCVPQAAASSSQLYHPFLAKALRVAQQVMRGGSVTHAFQTPCNVVSKLGYPALDRRVSAGARLTKLSKLGRVPHLVSTNLRLLNCSAIPPSKSARRMCTCTQQ